MIAKEKWIEIIKDFQEYKLPELISREVEIPLDVPINRAISIIGPRRAGKTYEMFQLIKKLLESVQREQLLYINFERADIGVLSSDDLVSMLNAFYEVYPENRNRKVWLFLDEIQNVANWEKFVRTALDEKIKVYLTGSSSKLLSREIATSMRGRSLIYTILPFSFRECLRAKKIEIKEFLSSSEKTRVLNLLKEYMNYGGYPEATIYESERERILADIRETAIYKDVVERSKIRNVKAMKLLINAMINSKEFSVNKFYNFLKSTGIKIGKNVLYKYIDCLNDVFFVFMLRKFSYSYKKAEQSIPKVYFIDNGLLRISGIQDRGRLMENMVFVELLRRGLDMSYYQSINKQEVDFVIKQNKKINQLIQVCYNIDDFSTKEREIKALLKAGKELKCKNLTVLNWDYEAKEKNIKFIPLWKWLLKSRKIS